MYKPFPPLPDLVSQNDIRKYSKQENGKVTVLIPFLENTAVFLTFYLCKFSLSSYFLVCCTFECRSVT